MFRNRKKKFLWFQVEFAQVVRGKESEIRKLDVIAESIGDAGKRVRLSSRWPVVIYGVHYTGAADEYYRWLQAQTAEISGDEDVPTIG